MNQEPKQPHRGQTMAAADFLDEYRWLRSFGKTDAAIAQQLRMSEWGLAKALQRSGVRQAELSPDHDIDARLQDLIAARKPFDTWDFPLSFDPVQVKAAISTAVRRGLVVRVGARRQCGGCRTGLFQDALAVMQQREPVVA